MCVAKNRAGKGIVTTVPSVDGCKGNSIIENTLDKLWEKKVLW